MADNLKYFVCVFQLEGHTTWHATFAKTLETIEHQLKQTKVTRKRFYEIDRLTGNMEEF